MPLTPAEYQRRYKEKHPERVKDSLKKWRDSNVDKRREYKLQTRRGISIADYDVLFAKQGGLCAICFTSDPSPQDHFCVDHCHETGAIRGLLCRNCNLTLGHARDNEQFLFNAITYLMEKGSSN
jgi:hypothetical protein